MSASPEQALITNKKEVASIAGILDEYLKVDNIEGVFITILMICLIKNDVGL